MKKERRDECSYGPEVWDKYSIKEEYINEAKKREIAANAFLGATFALSGLQSPKDFVRLGDVESKGAALMRRWAETRAEAERNLDHPRITQSARNRVDPPRRKRKIHEGRVGWRSTAFPLKSGYNPDEKNRAKLKSLEKEVFGPNPSPESIRRYKGLYDARIEQTTSSDSSKPRHVYRLEALHGINIGAARRRGEHHQQKLMPSRFKDLPLNKKRNQYYRGNLNTKPKEIAEQIDKNQLIRLIIQKMINEKKRKNYLLNYGYIGESKTPAWTRNAGKDLVKGGLNRKGIASYRRQNPGSKLSMAVTTKPSKLKKGSKSWKRRKSFCSRSAGQMRMWPKAARNPNSRLRLARKKWNC